MPSRAFHSRFSSCNGERRLSRSRGFRIKPKYPVQPTVQTDRQPKRQRRCQKETERLREALCPTQQCSEYATNAIVIMSTNFSRAIRRI